MSASSGFGVRLLVLFGLAACSARTVQPGGALAAGSKSPDNGTPTAPVAIEGQVLGTSGEPISGALVSVASHFDVMTSESAYYEQRSDAEGGFRFSALPPGRYGVTATPASAGAAYGGVCDVPSAGPCRVLLRIGSAGATYRGVVRDERGAGVSGARISAAAFNENVGEVYVALTDPEGRYAFQLPSSNGYMLVADAPPRPRSPRQVEAASATVDFELGPAPAPRPSDEAISTWLAAKAAPLTANPELDATGDRALASIVGSAPIVALGEVAHGAGDFTSWRRRVFQSLVAHHGFSVYAVEASWEAGLVVDDYIVNGKGTGRSAIQALGGWKNETQETLELIEWMRAYNADPGHRKKLHFVGIDPIGPRTATELVTYLRRVDPAAADGAERALEPLARPDSMNSYGALPKAERERVGQAISAISASLDARREDYIVRSSAAAHARACQYARILGRAAIAQGDYSARDAQMFETFREWALQHPRGTRFLVDAHAMHVAAEQHGTTYLGRLLREHWGTEYVAIALTFRQGAVRAMDWADGKQLNVLKDHRVQPAPRGTFDGDLALAGLPVFLIDLRGTDGPIGAWLRSPQRMRSIGSRFLGQAESFELFTPARAFDAVLYVDTVSAIQPLVQRRLP